MRSTVVVAERRGPPEVLRVGERDVPRPRAREALVAVHACSVSMPDVQARYGSTPFPPRVPFVPGYAVIGDVVGVGDRVTGVRVGDRVGALAMVGGYAEHLVVDHRRLIRVPPGVDPVEAAPLILNHLVAYQVMHRVAGVDAGAHVLVTGAGGGIGTAFLQLGALAGLRTYGVDAQAKLAVVEEYGGVPVDYRTQDFVDVVTENEPGGLDAVFDGIGGDYLDRGMPLLRPGGTYVVYGNPLSKRGVVRLLRRMATSAVRRDGRRLRVYGTTSSLRHRKPFEEDWATLFDLLGSGRLHPVLARTFPLVEAAAANMLLEGGQVVGNIVLMTDGYDRERWGR